MSVKNAGTMTAMETSISHWCKEYTEVPVGFLLSCQDSSPHLSRIWPAALLPWQGQPRSQAPNGHTLLPVTRRLGFSVACILSPMAHQKKERSQYVLILSLSKQDTGQLSDWRNFNSQSICPWLKQPKWECSEKILFPLPGGLCHSCPEDGEQRTSAVHWHRVHLVMLH